MPGDKSIQELRAELEAAEEAARSMPTQTNLPGSVPDTAPGTDPYAPTTWGSNEFDFTTPSGQRCRLRKLPIEDLAKAGILDRMTRLPGLADQLVKKAEGAPPEPVMPNGDQIEIVTELVDILTPLVVVQPQVWPVPAEDEQRVTGRVYVDTVDFMDRVAIMNRVVGTVQSLDNFRQ